MAEITWKGGWSQINGVSDVTYYENDVVSVNNITYIATTTVAIGSPIPSSDMSKWNTFVSGAIGTSGSSGTSGSAGTSGNNGQTLTPLGVEADYPSLTQSHPNPSLLDTYILQDTSELWIYDPTSGAKNSEGWVNMGPIQGPTGLTGQIGPTGSTGDTGTSGSSGTSGASPEGTTRIYGFTSSTTLNLTHPFVSEAPLVQVYESNGDQMIPLTIKAVNSTTVQVTFAQATTGKVVISSGLSGTSGTAGSSGTSGIGLTAGGTTGQLLVKNSSTDYDASWLTASSVGVMPTGGTANQILLKSSGTNFDARWVTATSSIGVMPTGGTSGQILVKNSGNNYDTSWSSNLSGTASFAGTASYANSIGRMIVEEITVGGSTTAPTKGSTRTIDKIVLADHGNGLCTVIMNYYQVNSGGAGNGDYLFTLPGGYQFDTAIHSAYAAAGDPLMSGVESWIPGSSGMVAQSGTVRMNAHAAVWDPTRFRMLQGNESIYSSLTTIRTPIGSSLFSMAGASTGYQMTFTFKKA